MEAQSSEAQGPYASQTLPTGLWDGQGAQGGPRRLPASVEGGRASATPPWLSILLLLSFLSFDFFISLYFGRILFMYFVLFFFLLLCSTHFIPRPSLFLALHFCSFLFFIFSLSLSLILRYIIFRIKPFLCFFHLVLVPVFRACLSSLFFLYFVFLSSTFYFLVSPLLTPDPLFPRFSLTLPLVLLVFLFSLVRVSSSSTSLSVLDLPLNSHPTFLFSLAVLLPPPLFSLLSPSCYFCVHVSTARRKMFCTCIRAVNTTCSSFTPGLVFLVIRHGDLLTSDCPAQGHRG